MYYLDGKKTALSSMSDGISILAYKKAKDSYYSLSG
jgi:hypothetical protein